MGEESVGPEHGSVDPEQFASIVAHDLGEPLRVVTQYASMMRLHLDEKRDPSVLQYLRRISEAASRMQAMLSALSELARSGSLAFEAHSIDAELVVRQACENLKVAFDESQAEIEIERLPTVVADGVLLLQLFQNLFANALKFHGDEPPRIHVSCLRCGDFWRFSVRDQGIGIDPEHLQAVFELFRRLQPRDRNPGSGLGLAISKRIAERHGGRIWVESQLGSGSTFHLEIPVEPTADTAG